MGGFLFRTFTSTVLTTLPVEQRPRVSLLLRGGMLPRRTYQVGRHSDHPFFISRPFPTFP